ncbi:MAG TPA: TetR family transcriptional regulator [Janthinobacterium sp.]|nr:TetR family transcriptional regulator [Janthinobacterium sp.]
MKVSREQAAQNRERIVDVAARLFRERGYDGIGVSDLMKNAGLTHGGFYGHFGSKEDLLAEACEHALDASVKRWRGHAARAPRAALATITDGYLSAAHRDDPGLGCAIPALGSDIARLGPGARHAFTEGARAQMDVLAGLKRGDGDARGQAIAHYAAMVGALILARAVDDAALSDEILLAVARQLKGARPETAA